jgi:hypothetical protein
MATPSLERALPDRASAGQAPQTTPNARPPAAPTRGVQSTEKSMSAEERLRRAAVEYPF